MGRQTISMYMDRDVVARIRLRSENTGVSMSEIVRRILRKEFAEVAERDRSGPNVMSGGELSRID